MIREKAGSAADSIRDLSNVSLEELKAKAGGKLDSLKDLTGIHLEALRGKSAEQLAEMLKERESLLAALRKERRRFRKERIHSNPTAVSPKYAREFEELKKYFEDEGRNANAAVETGGFFPAHPKKNVPLHILAPRAVACDNLHLRASAHLWHVSAFLCNREFLGISCYIKKRFISP